MDLAKQIVENGIEGVSLTGGEPVVDSALPEIMKVLGSEGIEMTLVTSGAIVRDEVLDLVDRYGVFVWISLDGPKYIHNLMRGGNVFEKTMRSIEMYRERANGVGLVMALSKVNSYYVEFFIRIAAKLDIDRIAVIPAMPSGRALETGIYIGSKQLAEVLRVVDDVANEIGIYVDLWCMPFAYTLRLRRVNIYGCRTTEVIDIDPAGRLLLCDTMDIAIASAAPCLRDAIDRYLDSDVVKSVVYPRLSEPCSRCLFKDLCRGGCFSRAYTVFGDLNAGDPLCPYVARYREIE